MKRFKLTLEMLEEFLEQKGLKIVKKNGEIYYQFACPECKKQGNDSNNDHIVFYPQKSYPLCLKDSEHGKKIYQAIKSQYENQG